MGVICGVVGVGLGIGLGYVLAQPEEGVARVVSAEDEDRGTSGSDRVRSDDDSSAEPEPEEPESAPNLRPRDFEVGLKTRAQECFGSAGCNLTVQINPSYFGTADIDGWAYDVTYEIRGIEAGPKINTFTINKQGTASYDEEEFVQTSSSTSEVTAVVTEVYPR